MMSAGSVLLQTAEHGTGGNKRTPCPFHGCKRLYSDPSSLRSHIQDHEISAQSVSGKLLLCSTVGCGGSFPNMQKLMEHMRHHHKPNIFFICESCRTKLRSYRGLLTHLHTCSKVPRGKTKPAAESSAPQPLTMDQSPAPSSPQPAVQSPNLQALFPHTDSPVPPLLGPPFSTNPESSPPQRVTASDLPPSLTLDGPDGQSQTRPLEPGVSPLSAQASPAVWRKNQGVVCNRRVLWEHTKGCYTCVQCGHKVTNRKEMTHHISTQHSGKKPAGDA